MEGPGHQRIPTSTIVRGRTLFTRYSSRISTGIVNRIMPLLEELSADLTLNEHLLVPITN
jgi:hypothetical protein